MKKKNKENHLQRNEEKESREKGMEYCNHYSVT
jgi:hypothetical protein